MPTTTHPTRPSRRELYTTDPHPDARETDARMRAVAAARPGFAIYPDTAMFRRLDLTSDAPLQPVPQPTSLPAATEAPRAAAQPAARRLGWWRRWFNRPGKDGARS